MNNAIRTTYDVCPVADHPLPDTHSGQPSSENTSSNRSERSVHSSKFKRLPGTKPHGLPKGPITLWVPPVVFPRSRPDNEHKKYDSHPDENMCPIEFVELSNDCELLLYKEPHTNEKMQENRKKLDNSAARLVGRPYLSIYAKKTVKLPVSDNDAESRGVKVTLLLPDFYVTKNKNRFSALSNSGNFEDIKKDLESRNISLRQLSFFRESTQKEDVYGLLCFYATMIEGAAIYSVDRTTKVPNTNKPASTGQFCVWGRKLDDIFRLLSIRRCWADHHGFWIVKESYLKKYKKDILVRRECTKVPQAQVPPPQKPTTFGPLLGTHTPIQQPLDALFEIVEPLEDAATTGTGALTPQGAKRRLDDEAMDEAYEAMDEVIQRPAPVQRHEALAQLRHKDYYEVNYLFILVPVFEELTNKLNPKE